MTANYYKYSTKMNDRTYFTSVVTNKSGIDKRYFSNVESEIYFGDKEMTDLYQFEFGIDEKVLPIYGYNCYYASELVNGQRIVQGQFVVNYTDTMLIQNTLSNIDNSVRKEKSAEKYKPGGDLHHAIYDKEFDITIGYGYYNIKEKQTYNATCQTILGTKITGMHKVVDTTGQPILEVFTFVAKDFIEENITQSPSDNSNNKKDDSTVKDKDNQSLSSLYVCSDAYNSKQINKNNSYIKQNAGCEHFINNITYSSGMITVNIQSGNSKKLTLISGSIELTEKLSNTIAIPVFDFTSVSKSTGTVNLNTKYSSLIDKAKKNGKNKIKCTLRYKVKTSKEYNVIYKDGYIYI